MTVRQLPIMQIGDTSYFVDERLKEFRNINNPHDRLDLAQAVAKGLGVDAGFCESCGCVIVLNIEKFKGENCTSCEQFINKNCTGVCENITLCKSCCEEDFTQNQACIGSGFWGEPDNHREDREENDLP